MPANQWRLKPEQLSRRCNPNGFAFTTTAGLPSRRDIIGQPRGVRAIEFGIDMKGPGFNIYVLGPAGTGRLTTVDRFVEERATRESTPDDWLYVHNFEAPHHPRAIRLPAGRGYELHTQVKAFLGHLRDHLPRAFESDVYQEAAQAIRSDLESRRSAIFQALRVLAASRSLAIVQSPTGLTVAPLRADGQLMEDAEYDRLPTEQRATIDAAMADMRDTIEDRLRELRGLEREAQQRLDALAGQVAAHTVDAHLGDLAAAWADFPDVLAHLDAVRAHVIANVDEFLDGGDEKSPGPPVDPFRRYQINLFVDNRNTKGAPVVVINQPSFRELVGRIDHRATYGTLETDFTMIVAGALHRANGGYLVIRAIDVFQHPYAWNTLKRALTTREIRIQNPDMLDATTLTTQTLEPEPIPLDLKVILLGSDWLYYTLFEEEDDFAKLFKVKADFAATMQRTPENEAQYAYFIATRCHEEGLRHFDGSGVARVVEYGARLAEDQYKLSTRFGDIADLVREASYWAGHNGHEIVTRADVEQAVRERRYRHNMFEELDRAEITEGTVFVDTEGAVVGQVNSLTVTGGPDHSYGLPTRITAQVHLGREGVVQIDREVNLTGPIHNKGVLILRSYLGAKYAQERQLSLNASLTFEQNYGVVEGDSASTTELYALLSALSRVPIRQGVAVTGSVNQLGQIQAIGGINEKIEGFFDLCTVRGLTGDQGVLIPAANLRHLMLRDEVIEAVEAGRFHVWATESIDQGIEVLTGAEAGALDGSGQYPEGTVNRAVVERLIELDERMEKDDKDGDEHDEEHDSDGAVGGSVEREA